MVEVKVSSEGSAPEYLGGTTAHVKEKAIVSGDDSSTV
jgi:hypothetical protein